MKTKLLIIAIVCSINSLFSQTVNELLMETFGSGPDVTTSGINVNYCFQDQVNGPAIDCRGEGFSNPTLEVNDNEYTVTNTILYPFGGWNAVGFVKDHTSEGTNPKGRFLLVNIGNAASDRIKNPDPLTRDILYRKQLTNIIPNQDITITFWAQNILKSGVGGDDPNIGVELIKDFGLPTASILPATNNLTGLITQRDTWLLYEVTLSPGNNTELDFVVRSFSTIFGGNDIAIDDISVFQSGTLAVSDRVFDKISAYPNPTSGAFHIDNIALEKVTIYNTLGSEVNTWSFKNSINNTIDLSAFSRGVYFLKIQAEGATTTKKIIVE
jgi:large repetitive protein